MLEFAVFLPTFLFNFHNYKARVNGAKNWIRTSVFIVEG